MAYYGKRQRDLKDLQTKLSSGSKCNTKCLSLLQKK